MLGFSQIDLWIQFQSESKLVIFVEINKFFWNLCGITNDLE